MRSAIRLLAWLGVALLLLAAAAGCARRVTKEPGPARPGGPPTLTGEPYVIGAMFSITGDAASLGKPERDTAQMLEKMINEAGGVDGHPLKIVVEDTTGKNTEALNAAMRLVERENVLAVCGPSRTGTTLAVVEFMESAEVPLISCAAGIQIVEPVKKWVFKTPQSDRMALGKIVEHLQATGVSRVAFLSDNTGFGKSGLDEAEDLLPAAGIELVAMEEYDPNDTGMTTQLTKIKGTKAQAVVCWGTPPGPAIIAKDMRRLAMEIPLVCSHGVANETFLTLAAEAANGVVLPAGRLLVLDQIPADHPQKAVLEEYANRYRAAFDKAPDTFGGHAWDAIQLVVQALREVGPDRAKIRDFIEQTTGFVGTGGVFNFSPEDHNGLTKDAFELVEVVDGKWRMAH